ncbi:MAG: hypothetical protein EA403_09305 [Spirochaetaceae bacterium]|nr:MAG: hypothetical protein EA403_09305 [Spirochaetaceae bacterium]
MSWNIKRTRHGHRVSGGFFISFVIGPYLIALVVPVLFLVAMDGYYLMREGAYLVSLLIRARSTERMRVQASLDPRTFSLFDRAVSIRAFAENELGLATDRNFTRYIPIDRDYLVTVVSAAGQVSFNRYYWNYPLFGRAPYRGFFSREHAEQEAARLRSEGWDVVVRQVHAFSLLGVIGDPLYSFMADYTTYRLASLMFHEKTHSTIWLRGQVQFNEELASFVEHEGALRYLRARYGDDSSEYRLAMNLREDRALFRRTIAGLRESLTDLYESERTAAEMLTEKDRIIEEFRHEFIVSYDERFATEAFRGFGRLPINNALLDLYTTYTGEIGLLYELFAAADEDLHETIQLLHRVRAWPDDPRGYIRDVLIPELLFRGEGSFSENRGSLLPGHRLESAVPSTSAE